MPALPPYRIEATWEQFRAFTLADRRRVVLGATKLRRRRDEWIEEGVMEQLRGWRSQLTTGPSACGCRTWLSTAA
jgi:hypothetical protein